jgi:hypothetical protein
MDADLQFSVDLNKIFSDLQVKKEIQIGGNDAVMILGQRAGLPPVEMYFEKESGLLIRTMRYGQSPLGQNPTQIDYSDFREVAGVKVPFRWTSSTPTGRFAIQLESVQANVAIPQSVFQKPSATSEHSATN